MARFVFKLDPVLKARQHAEQAKQRAMAELLRERIALENILRDQQTQIDRSRGTMREAMVGPVQVRDVRSHAAATMRLMASAQKLAIDLAGVHQRIEEARKQLLEATRDRRAMELLREKRYMQYQKVQAKAEQAAMDELAVIKAARTKLHEVEL